MLPEEFERGMNQIVKVFKPKDWDQETSDLYFSTVRRWSVSEWETVVDECIRNSVYMPKPKNLLMTKLDVSAKEIQIEKNENPSFSGCECCNMGLIPFSEEKLGVEYDKVCACVCSAGEVQLTKRYGQNRIKSYLEIFGKHPEPVRELSVAANAGGNLAGHEPSPQTTEDVPVNEEYNDNLPF